jgi:3-phenylpropionate/trans-cinnamate dioxygenase ferredoxin reductase subunit
LSTRTAVPPIRRSTAAGDCTRFPSRRYGRKLRSECVQNAIDQAKARLGDASGKPQTYDPVPWFWSDQYESEIADGRAERGLRTMPGPSGDVSPARFSVEYRKAAG